MFENDNLAERLDFILNVMMDDCQRLIDTNTISDLDEAEGCEGIYHGNTDIQSTIANALTDSRIRNGFVAHWTNKAIAETAEAVGAGTEPEFIEMMASGARRKTAMYLGIIEHSIEHTGTPLEDSANAAICSTVGLLALLDGQWETALILFLKAVDTDENDQFSYSMAQTCMVLRNKAVALIQTAFDEHSIEDLLAGSSLL